jgi:hypothetical protein
LVANLAEKAFEELSRGLVIALDGIPFDEDAVPKKEEVKRSV